MNSKKSLKVLSSSTNPEIFSSVLTRNRPVRSLVHSVWWVVMFLVTIETLPLTTPEWTRLLKWLMLMTSHGLSADWWSDRTLDQVCTPPSSLFMVELPLPLIQIASLSHRVVLLDSESMTLASSHPITDLFLAACSAMADLKESVVDAFLCDLVLWFVRSLL